MFDWLGRISPKTKILFFASLLIFLPSAFLSYLGLQSVNEKIENLRAHYRSTVGLVRDKMELELLRIEDGVRTFILKSQPQSQATNDVQEWLSDLQSANVFLDYPFVVNERGGILSTMVSKGWTRATPVVAPRSSAAARFFQSAEEAELTKRDLTEAIRQYRGSLESTPFAEDRALLHSRIGRCDLKLRRFQEGISEYRQILSLKDKRLLIGSLPASVVALSQIADGYQALGDSLNFRRITFELYQLLVRFPWDIESGEYLYYLRKAHDALSFPAKDYPRGAESADRERSILDQVEALILFAEKFVPKIRSDPEFGARPDLQPQHLFISSNRVPHQVGFLKPPAVLQQKGIVALGYQFRLTYLTAELLPGIFKSAGLEPNIAVAVLDERDSVLYAQDGLPPVNRLAADSFSELFPSWKVILFDRQGRSEERLVGSERTLYLSLFVGIVLVMAVGIFLTVRAAAHEVELSQLKAEFVSNVSHELKTPLALIRMFGETLESGLVVNEAERKEFYGIIRKESERLTHLINNVLDFSRMDAGSKEYRFEEADVVDVVRSTMEAYKYHISDLGFEIESQLPREPLFALIDKDAISQAVLNLLDNATKYSDDAKYIRIGVSQAGSAAIIIVEDHGVGIPKEFLGRIFDKFYRVPNEKGRETRGSGLGLALTKHIIEAHRGTIGAESNKGKGSIFTIKIPLLTGAAL